MGMGGWESVLTREELLYWWATRPLSWPHCTGTTSPLLRRDARLQVKVKWTAACDFSCLMKYKWRNVFSGWEKGKGFASQGGWLPLSLFTRAWHDPGPGPGVFGTGFGSGPGLFYIAARDGTGPGSDPRVLRAGFSAPSPGPAPDFWRPHFRPRPRTFLYNSKGRHRPGAGPRVLMAAFSAPAPCFSRPCHYKTYKITMTRETHLSKCNLKCKLSLKFKTFYNGVIFFIWNHTNLKSKMQYFLHIYSSHGSCIGESAVIHIFPGGIRFIYTT
jgi:hypothetical protein